MIKSIIRLLFFLFILTGYSQKIPDSLLQSSYDELIEFYNKESTTVNALKYAEAYLQKAKNKKDTTELLTGYHIKGMLYDKETMLKYFDSILYLTKNEKNNTYPSSIYISIGNFYYDKGDLKTALDNYLKAKKNAIEHYNPMLIYNSNECLGIVRDKTKDTIAALKIHKENFAFVKNNLTKFPKTIYLSSLYALSNAYNNVKLLDSAKFYNQIGLKESLETKNKNNYNLFLLNDGTTDFYMKNYGSAISNFNKTKLYFKAINDNVNLSESLFFLAKSRLKLNEPEKALYNFKIIDTIFRKTNYVLPKLRESYEILIKEYKKNNDLNKQLYYLNQLIKLDSIITSNEIYLNKTFIKKYDIPKLVAEKENVISNLKRNKTKNHYIIYSILFVLLIAIFLIYWQYSTKKKYKSRFELLLEKNSEPNTENKQSNINEKALNVPEDITTSILNYLDQFEKEQKYLSLNVKAVDLAKDFKTNVNYLSKVVNFHKEQNFSSYINNLRVDYIIDQLKTNKTLRKFTVVALAREAGFKSSEAFSKAFYKKTGIKPSFFITELEKHENN